MRFAGVHFAFKQNTTHPRDSTLLKLAQIDPLRVEVAIPVGFTIGRKYSRDEIRHAVGGGDLQSYLPQTAIA